MHDVFLSAKEWSLIRYMPEWLSCTCSINPAFSSTSTLRCCHSVIVHLVTIVHFALGRKLWQLKQSVYKIPVLSSLCQHSLNVRLLPTCSSCIQYGPSFQHSLILTRYFDLHQMVSTLSVSILYSWSYLATLETNNPKTLHHILEEWTLHSDWLSHHQSSMIFSIVPSIFYIKRNLFSVNELQKICYSWHFSLLHI
jgi:hypothetical protein